MYRLLRFNVIALLLAVAVVASGCGGDQAAIEVNGRTMSHSEATDFAKLLAADPGVSDGLQLMSLNDGIVDVRAVGVALDLFVDQVVADEVIAEFGGEVTDADRAGVPEVIGQVTEELAEATVPLVAPTIAANRLLAEAGESVDAYLGAARMGAAVSVDPKYGTWADGQIVPPGA